MPGDYSVVLTANGKTFTQPLALKMEPRVKASAADLAQQFALSKKLYDARPTLIPIDKSLRHLSDEIQKAREKIADKAVQEKLDAFEKAVREFGPKSARPGTPLSLDALSRLETLFATLQKTDAAPTPRVAAAVPLVLQETESAPQRWQKFISEILPTLNQQLESVGIEKLSLGEPVPVKAR